MSDDENNDKFLKGLLAAMGLVITIMGAWSVYTQSNRFTWNDGTRHENRMDRIESHDKELEEKYDSIALQLAKIEGLILNLQYKLDTHYTNP